MKKELAILFFWVLLISSFGNVYAVGRGGGGDNDNTNVRGRADVTGVGRIDCENEITLPTIEDRIKCRIQNRAIYVAPANSVPEACRNLRTATLTPENARERCVAYYRVITPCYNSQDSKRNCLMRAAGITNSRLADETENREQKARNFMIALLYDLEEKIEDKNERGLINDETAAEGIAKIIEIKRMLLEGKLKVEIRPKLIELKSWWYENISPLRQERDDDSGVNDDSGNERTGRVNE